jgi:hypothetical protein
MVHHEKEQQQKAHMFLVVRVVWFLDEHELTNEPVKLFTNGPDAHNFAADRNLMETGKDISVSHEVIKMQAH